MKKDFFRIIFILILSSFCFCSCSGLNEPKRDDITYCEIIGDLYHTQYWDYNDKWDMKNMSLLIHYDDGTTATISATTTNASYVFSPESPVGLDHSVTSFKLVEGTYKDFRGKKHPVSGREFSSITIVDYPYSKNDNLFWQVFITLCLAGFGAFCVVLMNKKRKEEKEIL